MYDSVYNVHIGVCKSENWSCNLKPLKRNLSIFAKFGKDFLTRTVVYTETSYIAYG